MTASSPSALSTSSSDSMVEIKRPSLAASMAASAIEDTHYRLIYSKSKVYVHPTAYARDNIPGFVALVKREATNPIFLLAWIPESLLNENASEWDKFVRIEEQANREEEDEDVVFVDLPVQRPESYAFSVPLTSIYSIVAQPPTLSSWYGSVSVNLINGDTLPTLFFHDDESLSGTLPPRPSPLINRNSIDYPPPTSSGAKPPNAWGGDDLLNKLRLYAHVLRSNLQQSLFLIDPSRADIETHSTQIFEDDAVDDILAQSVYAGSHSPVPAHRRPRPLSTSASTPNSRASVLHRSLYPPSTSTSTTTSQARLSLLQSFSNITRATRHAAQNILNHPLAKPIIPHLPDPVQSFVHAPGEWQWGSWVEKGGVGEFESARVYLARWARIVAEEGERARRREAEALPNDSTENEASPLGIFELLHSTSNLPTPKSSRDPKRPVDDALWEKWFDENGRPKIRIEEMKHEVFKRGIDPKGSLRKRIWPFLLGVYEWNVTEEERMNTWKIKERQYRELKDEWCGVPEVFDRPDIMDERHRIDVDCRRTDRTHPLFVATPNKDKSEAHDRASRFSVMSPNYSDIGAQSPSNEHVETLAGILLTYHWYEKELGYVQGMSDLCAPLYVVMACDEALTFWCFVQVMERMKQNFLRDQSGMKKQLLTLQQLIGVMDPELYRHLEKTDGLNLFFCFRWVLIAFKREFAFDDVLRLWEVLWTDYYSNQFILFVALAVLESHRDVILRYLVEFDEILKYCNDLSMTIELDTTLAQAEVLFLSFAQTVADIDRRQAESRTSNDGLRRRIGEDGGLGARLNALGVPVLSDNLRELLETAR